MNSRNILILVILLLVIVGGIFWYKNYVAKDSEVCIQVEVQARNPKTGEIKTFGTPCDIPEGWDTLESSGNDSYNQNGKTYQRYTNTDLGINFAYLLLPNGYTLIHEDINKVTDKTLLKFMLIMNAKDYEEFLRSISPRDGPPAISIMIFDNKENQSLTAWVKDHALITNHNQAKDEKKVELAGANGIRYFADGLYQNDVIVLSNNYKMYVITGAYNSNEDPIRVDFLLFINNLHLF